jgi:hypothetical protein
MGYARECDQSSYFRADEVDPAVWNWIKHVLTTRDALADGLREQQEHQEEVNKPLRDRLSFIEQDLSDTEQQMKRLLDLYLTGEFSKDLLAERRGELEEKLQQLKSEQVDLQQRLEDQTISDDQVERLVAAAKGIAERLKGGEVEFEVRREIIDLLELEVTLGVENDETTIDVQCWLGAGSVSVASGSTRSASWGSGPRSWGSRPSVSCPGAYPSV